MPNKRRKKAAEKANNAIFTGGSFTGAGGIGGSYDYSGGNVSASSSLGDLGPIFQQLLGASSAGLSQASNGLSPEMSDYFGQAMQSLQGLQGQNQEDFAGLGSIFQNALGTANADPFDLGAGVSEKLRALSERRNSRETQRTFDRLFSSGNLGSSSGAAQAYELQNQQHDQGLQFDLAGLQAGQSLQQDAFSRALGANQARSGIVNTGANLTAQGGNMQQQLLQMILGNQQQGTNIGLQTAGMAGNLSQLPLAFLQALQGMGTSSSNSYLASAGVDQQNAQLQAQQQQAWMNLVGSAVGGLATGYGSALGSPDPAATP